VLSLQGRRGPSRASVRLTLSQIIATAIMLSTTTTPPRISVHYSRAVRQAAVPVDPWRFDIAIYGRCNLIERCVNKLKEWRGSPTGY
jgi:hypothetical protein